MNRSLYSRTAILTATLLALGCHSVSIFGQSPTLTIDDVVAKLQANLDSYQRSIPNFLAEEHMESSESSTAVQISRRGPSLSSNRETIAESTFRLKRKVDLASNTFTFEESRDFTTIDGHPAKGRSISTPVMLVGAFSGGLAFVSEVERECMTYTLEPPKPGKPIIVHYQSAPHIAHPEICILPEETAGRVWIDPASMQIERIEVDVPRHLLTPIRGDGRADAPSMTHWHVEVVFKPVVLNARTFWLPATIASVCSNDNQEWSFHGSYRNYRLLEVHSRVVVPGDTSIQ